MKYWEIIGDHIGKPVGRGVLDLTSIRLVACFHKLLQVDRGRVWNFNIELFP